MLDVTIIGSHSHVGSQTLGEVRHRLDNMFWWQLFRDGLQAAFTGLAHHHLRLWLEFMVYFFQRPLNPLTGFEGPL